jgi:hypothetical protein
MRDLRRAAREGRHAFLVSLARFPKRHPGAISGFFLALLIGGFALNAFNTRGEVRDVRTQIVEVERADPCAGLAAAVKNKRPRTVVAPLTRACVRFLDDLGPLVSQKLACAILRKGGYACPRPDSAAAKLRREGRANDDPAIAGPHAPPGRAGRRSEGADRHGNGTIGTGKAPKDRQGGGRRTDEPSRPNAPSVPYQFQPQADPPSSDAASSSPSASAPPADPPKGPVESVAEDVGGAVGDVGGRVDETTCSLAPPLCP